MGESFERGGAWWQKTAEGEWLKWDADADSWVKAAGPPPPPIKEQKRKRRKWWIGLNVLLVLLLLGSVGHLMSVYQECQRLTVNVDQCVSFRTQGDALTAPLLLGVGIIGNIVAFAVTRTR